MRGPQTAPAASGADNRVRWGTEPRKPTEEHDGPRGRRNLHHGTRAKLRFWMRDALTRREVYLWPIAVACEVVDDELGFKPSPREIINAFGWAWEHLSAVNRSANNADPRDRREDSP